LVEPLVDALPLDVRLSVLRCRRVVNDDQVRVQPGAFATDRRGDTPTALLRVEAAFGVLVLDQLQLEVLLETSRS
jgi:hypothetical protein